MTRVLFLAFLFSSVAQAYVPTVESLFRHGSNPDVSANALSLTLMVKRLPPGGEQEEKKDATLLKERKAEEFYKIFMTKAGGDGLKIAQTRYRDGSFSEGSLEHKIYYPNFTPHTLKPSIEQMEKGLFYSLLHSITLNNGSHMVNYLKSLGVPVKLNGDLINREKIDHLASYKRYLVTIGQNRNARKTEANPLRPEDAAARERVEKVMNESMYVDTKQVTLGREEGEMAWLISAGPFEAVVSYKDRHVQRMNFKSAAGELQVVCKDYWMANGQHFVPRTILIRDFSGENYQVEITHLNHYVEREDDIVRRLRKWDTILKGKESPDPRPEFLL